MSPLKTIRTNTFKAVLLALMVNYLFFSVGVIKATHLCMGREASVAFFSSEAEKCFCSKFLSKEKDACCDDKQEVIRIDEDQQAVSLFNLQSSDLILLEAFDLNLLSTRCEQNHDNALSTSSRDRPPKLPFYTSYCSFVFYDSDVVS